MAQEMLKLIVFCHRVADDKDFTEKIICIPPSNADKLEQELLQRKADGELDVVQVGRIYIQSTVRTPYVDETQRFLTKIDTVRLHSSMKRVSPSEGVDSGLIPDGASTFIGFDDVEEINS